LTGCPEAAPRSSRKAQEYQPVTRFQVAGLPAYISGFINLEIDSPKPRHGRNRFPAIGVQTQGHFLVARRSGRASLQDGRLMDKDIPSAKVLVVEDVALIRLTTVEMVEDIGFAAAAAADAQQALAMLKEDDGISILLTDLGLPGMSGRQLVEEALQLKPGLKVIVASGYREEGFAANIGLLRKPFDLQQLQRALQAV